MGKFEGHRLIKITNEWVYDIETQTGYKVELKKGKVTNFSRAFVIIGNEGIGRYYFYKYMNVPFRILRRALNILSKYSIQLVGEMEIEKSS